jgi:peptidoglycan/xylan/chitin deacetylase (PgdA/CDA1 family)
VTTRFIAAYDTERPETCLAACRNIRSIHEKFGFPGTFFIVGERLKQEGEEYREVLGENPDFEIASHTYSHRLLKDHPFGGPAVGIDEKSRQIRLGKEIIEQIFRRPCIGLRPGYGFDRGLSGEKWLLGEIVSNGFGYISSLLWGPDTTMPALLTRPYNYSHDGFPTLWELPGHGWHENLLKAHNSTNEPKRIIAWPILFPEIIPQNPISTPLDEFMINRSTIDRAIEVDLPYVSLIWHPWSLFKFDQEMKMLSMTFSYIRDIGIQPTTYLAEWKRLNSEVSDE